jgi:AraC family transcriptional regulator
MDDQLNAICRALDFIEQHLKEEIRVEDMAECCGYSLFYFIRLFNQTVHLTPYDYLIRRRLAEAARELLSTKRRLVDIALDYDFQNPETFARAFNRVFHTPPSQVRKSGVLDSRLIQRACGRNQLLYYRDYGTPKAQQCTFPQILLAGSPFESDLTVEMVEQVVARLTPFCPEMREFFWISTYPSHPFDRQPTYFAGVELHDWTALPTNLFARRLPSGRYACFRQRDLLENLGHIRAYVYQSWQANTAEMISSKIEIFRYSLNKNSSSPEIILPLFNNNDSSF